MNKWISVKDRLPEKEYIDGCTAIYPVIKSRDNKKSFCRFYSKYWKTEKPQFVCIRNGKIVDVKFWLDIPESPK